MDRFRIVRFEAYRVRSQETLYTLPQGHMEPHIGSRGSMAVQQLDFAGEFQIHNNPRH